MEQRANDSEGTHRRTAELLARLLCQAPVARRDEARALLRELGYTHAFAARLTASPPPPPPRVASAGRRAAALHASDAVQQRARSTAGRLGSCASLLRRPDPSCDASSF